MPLIMDQNLDELFGDVGDMGDVGDAATLQLPPAPPAKGLPQRIDDLHVNGCNQKISWSKFGCIAYITSDNRNIRLANLRCNPKTGDWEIHTHPDATLEHQISKVYKGRELAHLSWNITGLELVIADIYGRLTIFTNLFAINRVSITKTWLTDAEDNLNALVGTMWLNNDKQVPLFRAITKTPTGWTQSATQHKARGPYNPSSRPAMLAVTKGGTVKIIYQQADGHWSDARQDIGGLSQTSGFLTHAAFSTERDDAALLVVYSPIGQLRLYRIVFRWEHVTGASAAATQSTPLMSIHHLKIIDDCHPIPVDSDPGSAFLMTPLPDAQLSHLEFVTKGPEARGRSESLPLIIAAYTYSPPSNDYNSSELREGFSIISRWEVREEKGSLHPGFQSLAHKKGSPSKAKDLKPQLGIRRLEDTNAGRVLLSIQQLNLATILAFLYSDGSVEFRDRATFHGLAEDGQDVVSGLTTTGFAFSDAQPCLHVALSPNACVKVSLAADHQPKVQSQRSFITAVMGVPDELSLERITMAFIFQNFSASMVSSNNDDLLLVMQLFMRQLANETGIDGQTVVTKFQEDFLREFCKASNVNLDYALIDYQRLLRHPLISKCFSMQAALNFRGENENKTLTEKIAISLSNLRMISTMFQLGFTPRNPGDAEINKPDVFQALIDLTRWTMHLIDYVVDQIFELNRSLPDDDSPFDSDALRKKVYDSNSPALHIILMSSSRVLLRYICLGLRGIFNLSVTKFPNPQLHAPMIAELSAIKASSHISAEQFERILAEVESGVRKVYTGGNGMAGGMQPVIVSETQRSEIERGMVVRGDLPDLLMGVVERLLDRNGSIAKLRDEVDEPGLYFKDLSIVGLGDDKRTKKWHREHVLDAVRKVVIDTSGLAGGSGRGSGAAGKKGGPVKLRVCTRCGSRMEDLLPVKGATIRLLNLQRICFCGGGWMIE